MNLYETLILAIPEITGDEATALEKELDAIIKKGKGEVRSFERWGKYKLAYPVKKNDYGVYFLLRFQLTDAAAHSAVLKELYELFMVKYNTLVMRHMNTRLQGETWPTYQKPDSLEDIPTQDINTFLRENKMEGLIKPGESSRNRNYVDSDKYAA